MGTPANCTRAKFNGFNSFVTGSNDSQSLPDGHCEFCQHEIVNLTVKAALGAVTVMICRSCHSLGARLLLADPESVRKDLAVGAGCKFVSAWNAYF